MIIHLEADWGEAILERFALVIAQQSQHFALQLTWILQGAIEDYQPETSEGRPNPGYNQLFYRLIKMDTYEEELPVFYLCRFFLSFIIFFLQNLISVAGKPAIVELSLIFFVTPLFAAILTLSPTFM